MNNQISNYQKIFSPKILSLSTLNFQVFPGEVMEEFHLKKRSIMKYRLSFLTLGIAFVVMAVLLSLKTPNWIYNIVFGYGLPLKTTLTTVALGCAFSSLWLGCYLRTEHELTKEYSKKYENHLKRIFIKKSSEIHLSNLSFQEKNLQENLLKIAYDEILEEMGKASRKTFAKFDLLQQDKTKLESQKISLKLALLSQFKNHLDCLKKNFIDRF